MWSSIKATAAESPLGAASIPEEAARSRLKRKYEAALSLAAADPEGAAEVLRDTLAECEGSARVHFLVLSNLARLAARRDPSESLRLLLEAGLLQARENAVGADVLLRIVSTSADAGDTWTPRWALHSYLGLGGRPCAAVSSACDRRDVPAFEGSTAVSETASPFKGMALGSPGKTSSAILADAAAVEQAPAREGVVRSHRPARCRSLSRRLLGSREETSFPERFLVRPSQSESPLTP